MQADKNITPITGKRFNILIIENNKAENKIDVMQLLWRFGQLLFCII